MPWLSGNRPSARRDFVLGMTLLVIGAVVVPLLYFAGMISPSTINKLGQYLSFAMIAIGLDLVWGYLGVLSLCQCLFFALGGYAMGFYLINHGPVDEFGIPACLAYVMSDVTDKKPPAYLAMFHNLGGSIFLGMVLSGGVAFLIGVTCFRSRVRGVYFSILTQAILVAFWNVWVKNDMKMGGTNGLTFDPTKTEIMGVTVAGSVWPTEATNGFQKMLLSVKSGLGSYEALVGSTRFWLYMVSLAVLTVSFILVRRLVRSRFGRVMVAIRDDETRLRFTGYQTWVYKAAAFGLAGVLAGLGGMLYVPQKGIITPKFMEPFWSIMVVVWVALGGRSTLWGAVLGTIGVSILYDTMTSLAPEYWKLMLGALFILVPLLLPGGMMSLPSVIAGLFRTKAAGDLPASEPLAETSA
jgi:ABC-type branched-subunit amino acid transport system permease subunit